MKPLKEIRNNLEFNITEITSQVKYFKRLNIDWEVYLPSKGKNLQRAHVWSLEQKRELIWSVLIDRHIPHCAIINIIDPDDRKGEIYQIIDGKQRLSTIFNFIDDKFTINIDDHVHFFSGLPEDYQRAINNKYFRYYIVHESFDKKVTDDEKIAWFKYINFAGTPQDKEHIDGL